MSRKAVNQANEWASQRKQAVEKSKQLRDGRKYNLAFAGEMSVASNTASTNGRRKGPASLDVQYRLGIDENNQNKPSSAKYGISLVDYMPSENEIFQAKNSLMLLKSKMRDSEGNPLEYYPKPKSRGYIDEETHEYMEYAPGDRPLEQDYNFNDVYQNGNPYYRKVFKPVIVDRNYPTANFNMSREMQHQDQMFEKKANLLAHANRFGPPGERVRPQFYQPPPQQQQPQENSSRRPPMGSSRFAATKRGTHAPSTNEDLPEIQSSNIPSRRPQKTISSAKGGRSYIVADSYEDGPKSQYSKQYQSNRVPWREEEDMDSQYNNAYETGPQKSFKGNSAQNNRNTRSQANNNKGYSAYNDQEEAEEDTTTFTKPSFKKKPPATKTKSPIRSNPIDDQSFGGFTGTVPAGADDGPGTLIECPHGCGRRFNAEVLDKHANICQKVFQSKRKKFDSAQQRAEGNEELESDYAPQRGAKKSAYNSKGGSKSDKNSKWKAQSEAFRANMRAARGEKISEEDQRTLNKASQDQLVGCPHCGRKFNEQAAARHISFCQTKSKIGGLKKRNF